MNIEKRDFKENNYDEHIIAGLVIGFISTWLGCVWLSMDDLGWFFKSIVSGIFFAGAMAFLREVYYGIKTKAPFSLPDILWTIGGGVVGSIIHSIVGNSLIGLGIAFALIIYLWKFSK